MLSLGKLGLALLLSTNALAVSSAQAAGDMIKLGDSPKNDVLTLGLENLPEPKVLELGNLRSTEGKLPEERLKLDVKPSSRSGSTTRSKSSSRRKRKQPTFPANMPPDIAGLPLNERLARSDLPNYGKPYGKPEQTKSRYQRQN